MATKGWNVTYIDGDGRMQFARAAISDKEAAIQAVVKGRNATEVSAQAFKDGDFEAFNLVEGEVIHSAGIN